MFGAFFPALPRLHPGQVLPTADQYNALVDAVERLSRIGTTGRVDVMRAGNELNLHVREREVWDARITGTAAGPVYAWQEVLRQNATWVNGPRSGTTTTLPGRELTDNAAVPTDGTAVVAMWYAQDGTATEFAYNVSSPCCCCDSSTTTSSKTGPGPSPNPGPGGVLGMPPGGGTSSMTGTLPGGGGGTTSMTTTGGTVPPDTWPPSVSGGGGGVEQRICQQRWDPGANGGGGGYVSSCFNYSLAGVRPGGGGGGDGVLGGAGGATRPLGSYLGENGPMRGRSGLLSIYGLDNPGTAGNVLTSNGAGVSPSFQAPGSSSNLTAPVTITQGTVGNDVLTLVSTATNDDPQVISLQDRVATTDASGSTIHSVALADNTAYLITSYILARRTGGSGGSAGDSAAFIHASCWKRTSGGGATQVGTIAQILSVKDNAGLSISHAASGNNVNVNVVGAINNNYTWHLVELRRSPLSS